MSSASRRWRVATLFLILCAFVSLGIGVGAYSIYSRPIPNSEEGDLRGLCQALAENCLKKGYQGRLSELEQVAGPGAEAPLPLVHLINSHMSVLFPEMLSRSDVRKEALRRISDVLKEKEWVDKVPQVQRHSPDYFLMGSWAWVVPEESLRVSVRVVRLTATADFIEETRTVFSPIYLQRKGHQKQQAFLYLIGAGLVFIFSLLGLVLPPRENV